MGWVCVWYPNNTLVIVKAIEMNVSKAERIVRCIYLLHNIIMGLEATTQDPSVLQETYKLFDPVTPQQMSAVDHSIGPQKEQQI
jgi:hypothetical protein